MSPPRGSLLTRPLGLEGWHHLETVLLAAVASETPLLLVGPHGCAKSFFLERLAQSLALTYRFYNASLINYDDLVGIPIPSEDRQRLEYIATPSSIWDAEVVFMDEINRTKPELQNKIFPIIHERRVQGVALERLRFRWAAMNPPIAEDDENTAAYLGAQPLDTALADRFGFVVEVPSWDRLSNQERRAILADQFGGNHPFPVPIGQLIERTRARLEELKRQRHYDNEDYIILLSGELAKIPAHLSTRRMTMLHANILAVHAAAETLSAYGCKADPPDWSTSAWTALQHSLPHLAEGCAPDPVKLRTAHLQAWQLMQTSPECAERILLTISDPLERAAAALRRAEVLSPDVLGDAIINCIADAGNDNAEESARILAIYLASHRTICLPHTALATMAGILHKTVGPIPPFVEMEKKHVAYLTELAKQVENLPADASAADFYAVRLAMSVYNETKRVLDCKNAIKRFHALHTQFNEAMAA